MPLKYTYLLVDACCIFFPLAFSFHPRLRFYRQWRHFWAPCLFTAVFFLAWDILFTKIGVWSFNPKYVCGISFFSLPLEEYLFFFCIPYACVFTYYSLGLFFSFSRFSQIADILTWLLIGCLSVIGAVSLSRLYTSVTFLLLSALLLFIIRRRLAFLPQFYCSFLIILIPFFISNGILTGSFTAEPVVIYNNHFNLGLRMFTIPVEDTFYGMILLLMNVTGFEYLHNK